MQSDPDDYVPSEGDESRVPLLQGNRLRDDNPAPRACLPNSLSDMTHFSDKPSKTFLQPSATAPLSVSEAADPAPHARARTEESTIMMVELQVETMSTLSTRIFLYVWYAVLLLALLVQSTVSWQWEMRNFCGAGLESLNALDAWNSTSCLQWQAYWVPVGWEHTVLTTPVDNAVTKPADNNNKQLALWDSEAFKSLRYQDTPDEAEYAASFSDGGPTMGPYEKVYHMRWVGSNFASVINLRLSRYVRIMLSLGSPMANMIPTTAPKRTYRMIIALEEEVIEPSDQNNNSSGSSDEEDDMSLEESSSSSRPAPPPPMAYTYNATVTCYRDRPRCTTLVLPPTVVIANNESRFTLTLLGVDATLAEAIMVSAASGFNYQRSAYTLGTMIWRYASIVYSVLIAGRFIYRTRYYTMVYEQYWVLIVQCALLFYLNPCFAFGVFKTHSYASLWQFLELHVPTYFAATMVCFTFAVIAASFSWGSKDEEENEKEDEGDSQQSPRRREGYHPPRSLSPLAESMDARRRRYADDPHLVMSASSQRHMPPHWVNAALLVYFLSVVGLDIAKTFLADWHWGAETVCNSTGCIWMQWLIAALLLLGIVVSGVSLLLLQRNLARRSYLESRPQQLASRIFIFIFYTAVLYLAGQVLLVTLLYPQILDIVYYQPLIQLSPMVVCTVFINHITYIYTATEASQRVPIRPDNPLWKRTVWSRRWFRWLEWHGGSRYIFFSEEEERRFEAIQRSGDRNSSYSAAIGRQWAGRAHDDQSIMGVTARERTRKGGSARSRSCPPTPRRRSPLPEVNREDEYPTVNATAAAAASSTGATTTAGRKSVLLGILGGAQRALTGGAAVYMDFMEDAFTDGPLQALLRSRPRRDLLTRHGFFNLETAIDCLNLSWEAYALTTPDGPLTGENEADLLLGGGSEDEAERGCVERAVRWCLTGFLWWYGAGPAPPPRPCDEVVESPHHHEHFVGSPLFPHSSRRTQFAPSPWQGGLVRSAHRHQEAGGAGGGGGGGGGRGAVETAMQNSFSIDESPKRVPPLDANPSSSSSPPAAAEAGATPSLPAAPARTLPHHYMLNPERYGFDRVAVIESRDVQVVIARMNTSHPQHVGKPPRLVIAFRGTDNVSNAMQDIRISYRTWKEMETGALLQARAKVHSGFLETWMCLKESVVTTVLNELQHGGATATATATTQQQGGRSAAVYPTTASAPDAASVYVTGHSLGGALACLCAYSLRRALLLTQYVNPDVTVYTFGQPCVGNSAFQRIYNRAVPLTFRVVNESDAVSEMLLLGRNHVGTEVDVDRHGNYVCRPMYVEQMFRPTQGHGFAVHNHTLVSYAGSLNAIADRHAATLCPARCLCPYTDGEDDGIVSFGSNDDTTDDGGHGREGSSRCELGGAGDGNGSGLLEDL